MKLSIIEQTMIDSIMSTDNNIRLDSFYDMFAFDLIEDDVDDKLEKNDKRIITLNNIINVANYLIERDKLSADEINKLVLYVNSELNNSYLEDENFLTSLNHLSGNIKNNVRELSYKIRKHKKDEEKYLKKEITSNQLSEALDSLDNLSKDRIYIKISLNEMEKIKRSLVLMPNTDVNLILRARPSRVKIKQNLVKTKENELLLNKKRHKLIELAKLIENDDIDTKETLSYILNLIRKDDIKDSKIRNEIRFVISKLKEKQKNINNDIKELKEDIKYLEKLDSDIIINDMISDAEYQEIKEDKKRLKLSYDIINSMKKDPEFSSKAFKAALRNNKRSLISENDQSSVENIEGFLDNSNYHDADIKGYDIQKGLGYKSEEQINVLNYEIRHLFDKYQIDGASLINEAFYIKNEYNKISSKKYAFSLEKNDDKIVVKMHVINAEPYVSKQMKSLWYAEFFKKIHNKYEADKVALSNIASGLKFKTDGYVPTIAYTFTFNNNLRLDKFHIEKNDVILRDIRDDELDLLNDITNQNNDKSYRNNIFFEKLLHQEFIKYALINDLPVIYYGKYNDESYGKYRQAKKIGREKMNSNIEKLNDLLYDVDGKTYDNVCWRWYKNYKIKHFSLEYQDDCLYQTDDLGVIDPASFIGCDVQYIINKLVFDKGKENYKRYEQEKERVNSLQNKYIKTFNSACGFIEIDDYIKMISKILGFKDEKRL